MSDLTLEMLRRDVLALQAYPQIIGGDDTVAYPETEIEKAFCALLWEIDQALRKEIKERKNGPTREIKTNL